MEPLFLFSHNQTSDWSYQQSQEKRKALIQATISLSTVHKAKFCERIG